jgi:phospholipid/cholesterol/gamma-HCH transport system substrate-binding protein
VVTQAPKRSAVFAAIAFALSCIGLMIFVWTQFGGTIPLGPQGYRLKALFRETGLLVPGADVRISGVSVGRVADVQARGVNSLVTMDVRPLYAPIPKDTSAILRQKTLLGEAYVQLSTGTGSGPKFADGGTIPVTQVQNTQQLDQVLGSFDTRTQHNLQALLTGTGAALAGRGQDLNDAIGNLDPAVTELSAVIGVLNQQQGNLRQLINGGATVLTTLGDRSADLQSLITAGDSVLSATAERNAQLTATVNALPPFLAQLRTTLTTLGTTLDIAGPSLRALRPVAPLLTPALRELTDLTGPALRLLRTAPGVLREAESGLPAIERFSDAFRPGTVQLLSAAEQIVPVIDLLAQYRSDLVAAMSNLASDLQASTSANNLTNSASYLRAVITLGRSSIFGASVRDPTTRTNVDYAPGELSNISSGGLLAQSCANATNVSQVPLPFGNVPCRLQPAFPWGHGVATSYFPRVKALKP